jgi:hypothetical protein
MSGPANIDVCDYISVRLARAEEENAMRQIRLEESPVQRLYHFDGEGRIMPVRTDNSTPPERNP